MAMQSVAHQKSAAPLSPSAGRLIASKRTRSTSKPMLEFMFNTIAVIGFVLLITFAWIGFKFVAQAFSFAAEMALLDWKYEKAKNMANTEVAVAALNKLRKNDEEKQG